ncbi:hypothetical protein Pgin01_01881 [Porphyromonas gingivalis]
MSKHLTDSERLHIVEEYLGSPGSKYAIEKKHNIAQGLIKRPLKNKEVEGRGVLGIKGASERGGSKE